MYLPKSYLSFVPFSILILFVGCGKNEKAMLPPQLTVDDRSQIIFLEKNLSQEQDNDKIRFKLAKLYFGLEDLENADKHISAALTMSSKPQPEYLFLKSKCLFKSGNISEARKVFEAINEQSVPQNDYVSLAADIYFGDNDYSKALNYLDRSLAQNPSSSFLYYKKGVIYESVNDTLNAIENYAKSIELNPGYTEAYIQWAELENKRGNHAVVKQYLQDALKYDTLSSNLYFHLALAYKKLNLKDSSSLFYEKAIQYDSNYTDALYNISIIYLQQEKYDSAEQYLKRIAYLKPHIPNLNFKIAFSLDKQGKLEEATNYYEKIDSSDTNFNFALQRINIFKTKQKPFRKTVIGGDSLN